MKYFDELCRAMNYLASQPSTLFVGQAVEYKGTAMTNTLKNVPECKKLELPVAEEMQLGMSIGLALEGIVPVCIYPRWNFLLSATSQIVNHLDKLTEMSDGGYRPKVIIRTGIGSINPLNPGPQHTGDCTDAFRSMCRNIEVIRLEEPHDVFPAYVKAFTREDGKSTIVVEYGDYHIEK